MSLHNRHSVKFENERPTGLRGMPIACRVCDIVFFDNVSLVLHFECHVNEGFRLRARDLASLRSEQRLSSSGPPCSYSALARRFQRMNDCLRSHPLPVPSEIAPNHTPRDPNPLYIPLLNTSQPIKYSQVDPRNFAYSAAAAAPPLRERNGGQMRFPVHKNQEIIVISDDEEEDENKSSIEIDLTLKL
ncbi:hypothetical protein SASPL_145477 [Salvia splendens]|uniref:C2H2-type domain-containing protein n=1 Tax=Salvia splendens TaxID=180675 RepID=A0A8X8Z7Q0_SALSN|nr:hypothetical protein SASPL_145477 [Salvia splendens]